MEGPQELGGEPGQTPLLSRFLSDLAEVAGEVSLHQASDDSGASEVPGRQSVAHVEWVRIRFHLPPSDGEAKISGLSEGFSTYTSGGLDPGEHSGAWGQFEGFRESSAKFEQFSQFFELPERATAPEPPRTASAQKECGFQQPHQGGPWVTGTAAISPSEPILSYENIFRFAFQEVPVQQVTGDVPTLRHLLEIGGEEPGLGSAHKCCSESRKLWRALQSANSMAMSHCLWRESHCQANFLPVLGVDAAQNLSGGRGHNLEGSELREAAEVGVSSLRVQGCRALIQTQLSGTSGDRQGSLVITCSPFLQMPFHGHGRRRGTAPRKLCSRRHLKMTLFRSDVR